MQMPMQRYQDGRGNVEFRELPIWELGRRMHEGK